MAQTSLFLLVLLGCLSLGSPRECKAVRPCDNADDVKELKAQLDTVQKELRTFQARYNTDLKALLATEGDLGAKVIALRKEVGTKVAFSTSLSKGGHEYHGPNGNNHLIFKHVFTNVGHGYSSCTGKFTAPVRGVYYFNVNTFGYNGYNMGVILVKNGHLQVSTWDFKGTSPSHTASNSVILTLYPHETVHVVLWAGAQVYDSANRFTTFSGFLLFPL